MAPDLVDLRVDWHPLFSAKPEPVVICTKTVYAKFYEIVFV